MRQPSIIRLSGPRRVPLAPPPKRHPARELLNVLAHGDRLLREQTPSNLGAQAHRVLKSVPHRTAILARDLGAELGLDAGYLSRILASLEDQNLIRRAEADDRRHAPIRLTAEGRLTLRQIGQRRERAIAHSLTALSDTDHNRLADALAKASELLAKL